jgi:hypothetical protein
VIGEIRRGIFRRIIEELADRLHAFALCGFGDAGGRHPAERNEQFDRHLADATGLHSI